MIRKMFSAFLLCVVALTTVAMQYSFTPAKADSSSIRVEVINGLIVYSRGFFMPYPVGVYGVYNIVGEVLNNSTVTVDHVNVTASFIKKVQPIVLNRSAPTETYIQCILPGKKAPFRLALSSQDAPNVGNYTIESIAFVNSLSKPLKFEILNSSYYVKNGKMYSPGTVLNNGNDTATGTVAVVTYYNKTDGMILWASRSIVTSGASSTSGNVTSGAIGPFEVASDPLPISVGTCNFVIVAESKEYLSLIFTTPFQDTIKPAIGEPVLTKKKPTPTELVGINVTVIKPEYTSKLSKVLLHYKIGGGEWKAKNMTGYETTRINFKDLWRSATETAGAGQTVTYYIEAFDAAENTQTSPLDNYTVQGQSTGVPVEYVLIAFVVLILLLVVYRYRKRIF
jgi:hypothetical protein